MLYSNDFTAKTISYIHQNPLRALLVYNSEDYLYFSAQNYAALSAVPDVELLSLAWKPER